MNYDHLYFNHSFHEWTVELGRTKAGLHGHEERDIVLSDTEQLDNYITIVKFGPYSILYVVHFHPANIGCSSLFLLLFNYYIFILPVCIPVHHWCVWCQRRQEEEGMRVSWDWSDSQLSMSYLLPVFLTTEPYLQAPISVSCGKRSLFYTIKEEEILTTWE